MLARPSTVDTPKEVVMAVDVDYYVEQEQLLTGKQLMLYTVYPTAVAHNGDEFSFMFDEQGVLNMSVAGGAQYRHKLWNFTGDAIIVDHGFWPVFRSSTVYVIDRRMTHVPHHALVLFTPRVTLNPVATILAKFLFEFTTLSRLNPVHLVGDTKFCVLDVVTKEQVVRSIGTPNSMNHVEIPAHVDDGLHQMAISTTQPLQNGSVEHHTGLRDKGQIALLTNYHRKKAPVKAPTVWPMDMAQHRVAYIATLPPEDTKPSMQPFMNPIATGAITFDRTPENEVQAVNGRIIDVEQTMNATCEQIELMHKFALEFAHQVADHVGPVMACLHPVDIDVVMENQSRPSQRLIIEKGQLEEIERINKTFNKAEAYLKLTDPRVISTITPGESTMVRVWTHATRYSSQSCEIGPREQRGRPVPN